MKITKEFEMKDVGLMHYFLGLEVWKISEEIFLNQGKYVVEILKRFDMLECKAMATPMDSNLKLLANDSSELVDVTQYRHIITVCGWSIFYVVEILKRFDMLECKAMATPMDSNLKLLANDSSELVDVTQYRLLGRWCI